jgi:hypothetical protein
VTACVAEASLEAPYARYFGGVDYYADLAAEYSLGSEATRTACLRATREAPCDDEKSALPASCDEVLVAKRQRAEGDSCAAPSPYLGQRPCAPGLACVSQGCSV